MAQLVERYTGDQRFASNLCGVFLSYFLDTLSAA